MTRFVPLSAWEDKFYEWSSAFVPRLFDADSYLSVPADFALVSPALQHITGSLPQYSPNFFLRASRPATPESLLNPIGWRFFQHLLPLLIRTNSVRASDSIWRHAFAVGDSMFVMVRADTTDAGGAQIRIDLFQLVDDDATVAQSLPLRAHSFEIDVDENGQASGVYVAQALPRLLRNSRAISANFDPLTDGNGADAYLVLIDLLYSEYVYKTAEALVAPPNLRKTDERVDSMLLEAAKRGLVLQPLYGWLGGTEPRFMVARILDRLADLRQELVARKWRVDQDAEPSALADEAREQFLVDVLSILSTTMDTYPLEKLYKRGELTVEWYNLFFTCFWAAPFQAELETRILEAENAYYARRAGEEDGDAEPIGDVTGIDYMPHQLYDDIDNGAGLEDDQ